MAWIRWRTTKGGAAWRRSSGGTTEEWTVDDVERARCETNQPGRPRGRQGPSPEELFAGRTRVDAATPGLFGATVAQRLEEERATTREEQEGELEGDRLARAERAACARALADRSLLEFRAKLVPLSISPDLAAIIS